MSSLGLPQSTPLQRIGNRYILLEPLGEGGMGVVYRTLDRLTGNHVALKRVFAAVENFEFNTRVAENNADNLRLLLIKEFQMLASLRHPNIISVLDYGFDDERQPFFTMEYIANPINVLQYGKDLSPSEQVELLVQLLRALVYLHRRGILHRDIKPGNILIDATGQVKVLDFGLSQTAEQKGQTGGTLSYMAPEVLTGEAATPASDLYAVGIVAYELFSGKSLYDAVSITTMIDGILYSVPDVNELNIDTAIKRVVARLLAKQPSERYNDASEVIKDLQLASDQKLNLETSASQESFLQAARFVGRDDELKTLTDALDDLMQAPASGGAAFLIGGESGVGKSRLLGEIRTLALVRGATVLWGQAVQGSGLPYQPWRDVIRRLILSTPVSDLEASILRQLVPDIDSLLERPVSPVPSMSGFADRQHLILTIIDIFRRQEFPIVLIFEDLQWFYESLEPLRWVSDYINELPILVLCSFRLEEAPHLWDELPSMQHLLLRRLRRNDIESLTVSMLGSSGYRPQVLDLLEQETEGNAFFIIEVVRALAESVGGLNEIGQRTLPYEIFLGGLQVVVSRRLRHIPAESLPLLRLAAVLGRTLDLAILSRLANGINLMEWLTICVNAAVLETIDGQYRFAHDKLRQAVLLTVSGGDIPELHRMVAEVIESTYPDDPNYAAILANHWHTAGDVDQERYYTQLAGQRMFGYSHYRAARYQFLRSLELSFTVSHRLLLEKLLGDAEEKLGEYRSAVMRYKTCIDLAWDLRGDPAIARILAEALIGAGSMATQQSRLTDAEDLIIRGNKIHAELNNAYGLGVGMLALGQNAWVQGNFAAARINIKQSQQHFRNLNNLTGAADAFYLLSRVCYSQENYHAAQFYLQYGLISHRTAGDRFGAAVALHLLGNVAWALEDTDSALHYYLDSYNIRCEIEDRRGIADSLFNLGEISHELNDFPAAQQYFQQCLQLRHDLSDRQGKVDALVSLAALEYDMDDAISAFQHLCEATAITAVQSSLIMDMRIILGCAWRRVFAGLAADAASLMALLIRHANATHLDLWRLNRLRMRLEQMLMPEEMVVAFRRGAELEHNAMIAALTKELIGSTS